MLFAEKNPDKEMDTLACLTYQLCCDADYDRLIPIGRRPATEQALKTTILKGIGCEDFKDFYFIRKFFVNPNPKPS